MGKKLPHQTYVAIDEDAFGDGELGISTYPLDTWLEGQIDANIRHLRNKLHRAAYTFPHYFSVAHRTYFAVGDRAALYMFLVPVEPATQHISVKLSSRVRSLGVGSIQMKLWHVGGILGNPKNVTGSSFFTQTDPTCDSFGVKVEVDRPQMALMIVKMKDVTAFNIENEINLTLPKMANVGYDIDSLATSYKDLLETGIYTLYAGADVKSRKRVNVMHMSRYHPRDGSLTAGRRTMSVYPDLDPAGNSSMVNPKFKLSSSLVPESLIIEINQDERKPSRGFTPKSPGSLRANRPVTGNDLVAHQRNLQSIYESPRVHAYGPRGKAVPDSTWDGTNARWTKVYGDQSGRTIDDQLFFPVAATGTTRLTWYGLVCCAHLIRNQEDIWTDPGVWLDHLGEASWDLRMDIYDAEDGNSSWAQGIFETHTSTHVLPMWAADHQMQIPILNQLWWSYFDDGAGGSRWSKTSREGVTFTDDWKGPAGQAPIVAISQSVEFEVPNKYNPLRIRMRGSGAGDPTYAVGEEVDQRTSRVVMACISSTLVEEPVFSG